MAEVVLPEGPLVTTEWLNLYKRHPRVKIVEARMKPVGVGDDWESGRKIIGAVLMDINRDFSLLDTDLPHMMPSATYFSEAAQKIGINKDSIIVVYDQVGTYGSPRGWWMFRAMGHEKVFVLDGGFPAWEKNGFETEPAEWPEQKTGDFEGEKSDALLFDSEGVLSILGSSLYQILDARSQSRFDGMTPEPRPGLRGGHIPGAFCLPFTQVQNGIFMKTKEELEEIFGGFNLSGKRLVMSCGSGVTASIVALAAEIAGYKNAAVYDGSWSEWGMPNERYPVETISDK
jgi:thiosulfate/3-mercaptopyruvate sulfurtransferase